MMKSSLVFAARRYATRMYASANSASYRQRDGEGIQAKLSTMTNFCPLLHAKFCPHRCRNCKYCTKFLNI